ncbi:MAG: DUF4080 domain-containing protein, partial [Lachnospiraceae bacterium]|nr:DUF4080 domain-containing protein [Lachnospiraceae bacterium]
RRYLPGYREYDHKQLSKMTHLEPFRYPVWDEQLLAKIGDDAGEEKTYVLFEYRSRDVLTCEAGWTVVKLPETRDKSDSHQKVKRKVESDLDSDKCYEMRDEK